MVNDTASGQDAFLADIADKLESAASNLDCGGTGAAASTDDGRTCKVLNANFASKLAYTACYTFSYGVCFPIFVVCHYVPKNNRFVEGLVDGGASANQAVDDMLARAQSNRLARKQAAAEHEEREEIVEAGIGALEPA